LVNNSGTIGYLALQGNKGRIIVIDNELNDGMIINKKYVIGHSSNILLRKPTGLGLSQVDMFTAATL